MSPPPNEPASSGQAKGRRRVWILAFLLVGAAIAGLSLHYRESALRRMRSYRVGEFMRQAQSAYRAGEVRTGNLAIGSVLELEPANSEAKLLRAKWLLRVGPKEDGINAWRAILLENDPNLPRTLPLSYASHLINTGTFDELFLLAIRQLSQERVFDRGIWINLAAEAARLGSVEPDANRLTAINSQPTAAAIHAYALARRGKSSEARRVLNDMDRQALPHTVAVLAARTWLALGDETNARACLNRSNRAGDRVELAAAELLFEEGVAGTSSRLIATILNVAQPPPDLRRRVGLIVTYGLNRASPAVARQLKASLDSTAAQLDSETLSALWVYAGLSGDEASEVFWRQRLDSKAGTVLPRLNKTGMTPSLFSVIEEKAPMPIEIACTLLGVTSKSDAETAQAK